jgi:hypothetical protein
MGLGRIDLPVCGQEVGFLELPKLGGKSHGFGIQRLEGLPGRALMLVENPFCKPMAKRGRTPGLWGYSVIHRFRTSGCSTGVSPIDRFAGVRPQPDLAERSLIGGNPTDSAQFVNECRPAKLTLIEI